ncbi:MAG: Flp pilus assembly protein CpaB [Chloroflexi bacterium]|nr:Flp pilus assembly protein CpaB [Chloroflexota bacterium]
MKRSSRLIILVGAILAVAAFAGIIWWGGQGGGSKAGGPQATVATTTRVVQATVDIPLGTQITAQQLTLATIPVTSAPLGAYSDPAQLVGQVTRQPISKGDTLTSANFITANTAQGNQVEKALKAGYRAISVRVDQDSGVGTLIQPGDRVDMVIGLLIQEYVPGANPSQLPQAVPGGPQLSVKDILQNLQVLATLTPPPTATQNGQQATASAAPTAGAAVGLTGQQMIVILAVTAQQAEVIKYAQAQAAGIGSTTASSPISLILRSPADASAPPDKTSGVVLKTMIDQYGVLPPVLLEGTLPTK